MCVRSDPRRYVRPPDPSEEVEEEDEEEEEEEVFKTQTNGISDGESLPCWLAAG